MGPQLAACLGLVILASAPAQTLRHDKLAAGTFLVAPRKALDPNFAETVVLVVQYDEETTLGLVINQPSRATMTKLFPERKPTADDRVFTGGPVGRSGMLALLRSKTKPPDAQPVFDDVYLVVDRKLFEKSVASGADGTSFRVYLGYSGWGPGQLEAELENDMWHLFAGDVRSVFDPNPEAIWQRLVRRTELQLAMGLIAPAAREVSPFQLSVVSWKK